MSAQRWKRGHQERSRAINRAIEDLAALGPEDGLWALAAATDPAKFLRAVALHIQELREQLRAAAPNTARDVPEPLTNDLQPGTYP